MGERGAGADSRRLTAVLDAVLSVALAPSCVACDQLLDRPTGGPVCAACWRSILPLTPPLCRRCGDRLSAWRTDPGALCPRCRRRPSGLACARAIGAYDGALCAVLHALKYDGRRSLAVRLGRLMRERGGDVLAGAACAVPVPLHRSRLRERGFNQAEDLARALGLPVCRAVRRIRATPTQTGLSSAERHRNVRHAFGATRRAAAVAGAVVVLVDDVCTTGATLEACARVLRAAGALEVRALTAARVVGPPR